MINEKKNENIKFIEGASNNPKQALKVSRTKAP